MRGPSHCRGSQLDGLDETDRVTFRVLELGDHRAATAVRVRAKLATERRRPAVAIQGPSGTSNLHRALVLVAFALPGFFARKYLERAHFERADGTPFERLLNALHE